MCIVLLSTAHPAYPFILLSNRDEFLDRPTASANWWDPPNEHVLGGRDLERRERGTWLGLTRQGRIASLTNFREQGAEKARDKSRGGIINAYLTSPPANRESSADFARRLVHDVGVQDVGGFSLLFGELGPLSPDTGTFPGLSILSNRSASAEDLTQIAVKTGKTHGLSNSHFGDNSWPKVVRGEQLLREAVQNDVEKCERGEGDQDAFITSLFSVLSDDMLPARKQGEPWETYAFQLRNSIFIPPTGGPSIELRQADEVATAETTTNGMAALDPREDAVQVGAGHYGTQKQSVILVDQEGKVVFVERTLYGEGGKPLGTAGERRFDFKLEGWWA